MSDKYILDGHDVKAVGLIKWAQWFETADRHVAKTRIRDGVNVSTVFLGMGDQMFETMIFGGKHDQYQERFDTWQQAEAGHQVAVALAAKDPS